MSREYLERVFQSKHDRAMAGKASRKTGRLRRLRPAKNYEIKEKTR